jgi:DNA-binding CsgD family transcriptional regulator
MKFAGSFCTRIRCAVAAHASHDARAGDAGIGLHRLLHFAAGGGSLNYPKPGMCARFVRRRRRRARRTSHARETPGERPTRAICKGVRTMSMLTNGGSDHRSGNVQAMLRLLQPLDGAAAGDPADKQRRLLADVVRMIGEQIHGQPPRLSVLEAELNRLPPRLRQTMHSLLAGDSEKQAAAKLGVSPHTVHVYVKSLYKRYKVSSRGELLSKWVGKN